MEIWIEINKRKNVNERQKLKKYKDIDVIHLLEQWINFGKK